MSKYIDSECEQCDCYIEPYGCTEHHCTIYMDYLSYQADKEYDRRKDRQMEQEWDNEESI